MYNNPYDHFRQQEMNVQYPNQMETMHDMGTQQPFYNQMDSMQNMGTQQPFFNQMPTMPIQPIQPMMPMGTVTGAMGGIPVPGTTSGTMPTNIGSIPLDSMQMPETPIMDTQYTQGYLSTKIGSRVKIEFLIGTNMWIDREGTLIDVGISYVIINEIETDDLLLCDIYSIKFVRFYR